jgi:hypothetical protein
MVLSSQNSFAIGSFNMFRDPAGGDPSSPFEDDPSLGESSAADSRSENLGVVDEDDDVEEEDIEDDGLEDEDEFEEDEDDEFDDEENEEDDDEEAALALHMQDDREEDDDSGDDGRENAVDEDKLNADEEDDFGGDDSTLDSDEVRRMRKGLATVPARSRAVPLMCDAEIHAILQTGV